MAQHLSQLTGIPVDSTALRRTRNTPPQVSMESPGDRHSNIADAFECPSDIEGRRYMLIDDVVTTGSTMSACADALKDAGAANVWGLAFARQGVFGEDEDVKDAVGGTWV